MNALLRSATAFLTSVVLLGCGASSPSCSDAVVKNAVIEVSTKELVAQTFKALLADKAGAYPASVLSRISVEKWKLNPPKPRDIAANFTFKVSEIHLIIEEAETRVEALGLGLSEIRVIERKNEINVASCGGSLTLSSGGKYPLSYSAQFTEDGAVYVKVKVL